MFLEFYGIWLSGLALLFCDLASPQLSDPLIALTGKEFFPQEHFHLNGFHMKFVQVHSEDF